MAVFNDIFCQVCDRFYTKNNGINTSILVGICIEKSMGIGRHFFHKEN